MTGIYGNSQEDKLNELKLEAYLNARQARDDVDEKEVEEGSAHNYNFPEYLNVNANFIQLVKFMNYQQLSIFVFHVANIADEKNDIDARNWASDQLNAFLNALLNRGE